MCNHGGAGSSAARCSLRSRLAASTRQAPNAGDASGDAADSDDEDAFQETRPAHGGYTGKLKGFDYSLAYETRSDGVTLTLEASNAEEGDEASDTGKETKEAILDKFKELSKEQKEAAKEEREAQKQVDGLQKDLQSLDNSYQQQVEQLKSGPRPASAPTDSNGFPLSLQGQLDKLTKT